MKGGHLRASFSFYPSIMPAHPLFSVQGRQINVVLKTEPLETEFKARFCHIWPMSVSYLAHIWKQDINAYL